jgi:hypothetical protein
MWTTSPAEEKYTSYELEVLVIVKALKEFRAYLLDTPFKIVTECRAFIGTEEAKKGSLHTYYEAILLEDLDYKFGHRRGKTMMHVDALSRNPLLTVMLIDKDERGIIAQLEGTQLREDDLPQIRDIIE